MCDVCFRKQKERLEGYVCTLSIPGATQVGVFRSMLMLRIVLLFFFPLCCFCQDLIFGLLQSCKAHWGASFLVLCKTQTACSSKLFSNSSLNPLGVGTGFWKDTKLLHRFGLLWFVYT